VPGTGERMGRTASNASLAQPGGFPAENNADGFPGLATPGPGRPSRSVLADRIAAALVHHEPGWRLPRPSAMARRYNVSAAEVEAALEELADRHLIRRLPDGQMYRASPAEYLIQLEGMPGLAAQIDPMSAVIACHSFQVSERRVPENVGWALQVDPAAIYVARLVWTAGDQSAALATTYFATPPPGLTLGPQPVSPASSVTLLPPVPAGLDAPDGQWAVPVFAMRSLSLEMQPPAPSVAKHLGMTAGIPAILITVTFQDPETGNPTALTTVALHPEVFRITIESAALGDTSRSWAVLEDEG
jgi:hypothetical protein